MEEILSILLRILKRETEDGEVLAIGEDQVIISLEECPAVLLTANKDLPKILSVQKFIQRKKKPHTSTSINNVSCTTQLPVRNGHVSYNNSTRIEDLDVTGSPLKCPFMQNETDYNGSPFTISLDLIDRTKGKVNLTYVPLPSIRANFIISRLTLALRKISTDVEFIPMWIFCDGKDTQRTLCIGIHFNKSEHIRTTITFGGPYYGLDNLPSPDYIMKHHIATVNGTTKRTESTVKATYRVLASEDEVRHSSLSLTCSWKHPLTILSSPTSDAHVIANVDIAGGDPRSPAHQMYIELSILRGLVQGLKMGNPEWNNHENSKAVTEEFKEMLNSIRENGVKIKREDKSGCDLDMMIDSKFFNWRQNMDFTDHLWTVLKRCGSYQELKDSLSFAFKAVAGEEIWPQIHVRNTTQIGCMLRNVIRGCGNLPELTDMTSLRMLIEIGCEKIKRDYINIFQAGDLVTGEQLAWFIGDKISYNDDSSLVIDHLERLHIALQVVIALRTYLSLPLASLAHFTDQVLKQMKEKQLGGIHTFSLKLDTRSVHQQLESMKKDTWEINLLTQEKTYSKNTVCHFSHTPLIQLSSTISEYEEQQEDEVNKDVDEEDKYFCTFISSVNDKLF